MSASVKAAPIGEKHHLRRFKIITPTREYLFEAEGGVEEAVGWMRSIHSASQAMILQCSRLQAPLNASYVSGGPGLVEELGRVPGNGECADCRAPRPTWASINLGVLICIGCSGVHRSLGCQVSKVRSLDLDAFLPETTAVLAALGNAAMNAIWEADLPDRSGARSPHELVPLKYARRAFTGVPQSVSLGSRARPQAGPRAQIRNNVTALVSPEMQLFGCVAADAQLALTAKLLFGAAVNVNTVEQATGSTPLHRAAAAGQKLQAHFLLLNGADPLLRDRQDQIPAEVALRAGHADLADHLARYSPVRARLAAPRPDIE